MGGGPFPTCMIIFFKIFCLCRLFFFIIPSLLEFYFFPQNCWRAGGGGGGDEKIFSAQTFFRNIKKVVKKIFPD